MMTLAVLRCRSVTYCHIMLDAEYTYADYCSPYQNTQMALGYNYNPS